MVDTVHSILQEPGGTVGVATPTWMVDSTWEPTHPVSKEYSGIIGRGTPTP